MSSDNNKDKLPFSGKFEESPSISTSTSTSSPEFGLQQRRKSLKFSDGTIETYTEDQIVRSQRNSSFSLSNFFDFVLPPYEYFFAFFGILIIFILFYRELGF